MGVSGPLPMEFEALGERQRELVQIVYMHGGATVREIHSRIPDPPPSPCGIRTLLNRMVRKGLLRARPSGRHSELLYLPVASNSDVRLRAFDHIARKYFRGSKSRAAEALQRLAIVEKDEHV